MKKSNFELRTLSLQVDAVCVSIVTLHESLVKGLGELSYRASYSPCFFVLINDEKCFVYILFTRN